MNRIFRFKKRPEERCLQGIIALNIEDMRVDILSVTIKTHILFGPVLCMSLIPLIILREPTYVSLRRTSLLMTSFTNRLIMSQQPSRPAYVALRPAKTSG